MLNLIVMSINQDLLDEFFRTLFPTIDENVRIYAFTEGLRLPEDKRVIRMDDFDFNPNRYFNMVCKKLGDDEYVGIVNDDIILTNGWLEDVRRLLKDYECASPGFVESRDKTQLSKKSYETRNETDHVVGMFDAFYCFPVSLVRKLGDFDENIIYWYDVDWYVRIKQAGYRCVTAKRVTIQHLARMSLKKAELPRREIKDAVIKKYGKEALTAAGRNSFMLRRLFK